MTQERSRVLWLAGTRGEVLRLAPCALKFLAVDEPSRRIHWFAVTGEQGMGVYQALDDCGMRPHAESELRHPAEDPAARLKGLIGEIEGLARRYRATHLVFSGAGATAAAAALVCHGREARGVWIPPFDPAGLTARFRWERGLESIIRSLWECVQILDAPGGEGAGTAVTSSTEGERLPGRRPEAPLALVAVTRPSWGSGDLPERVVRAMQDWARSSPEADWLFLRSLDARFEGPLRSIREKPANFLTAPPVPYAVYASWLNQAGVILTDSWAIAAEGLAREIPVVALGEAGNATEEKDGVLLSIGSGVLEGDAVRQFMEGALKQPAKSRASAPLWAFSPHLVEELTEALGGS